MNKQQKLLMLNTAKELLEAVFEETPCDWNNPLVTEKRQQLTNATNAIARVVEMEKE